MTRNSMTKYELIAKDLDELVARLPISLPLEKQLLTLSAKILRGYNVSLCVSRQELNRLEDDI